LVVSVRVMSVKDTVIGGAQFGWNVAVAVIFLQHRTPPEPCDCLCRYVTARCRIPRA
jgi:hypothetical protein